MSYSESERDRFKSLGKAWDKSERQDWSAWEEFEAMASAPGFIFKRWGAGGFFGEMLVGKELHDKGYHCWRPNWCHLFLKHNRPGAISKEQTDIVEGLVAAAGYGCLRDSRPHLSFRARDLDLIAHHPRHGDWRVCEVKWRKDPLSKNQLGTLAFLQHVLGPCVEVVRVVPEGTVVKAKQRDCSFTFHDPPIPRSSKRH